MNDRNKYLEDSGFDCDHCGGEICLSRELLPGHPTNGFYQCQQCGCEWSLKGDVIHIGTGKMCQEAQRKRMGGGWRSELPIPEFSGWRRALIIIGGLLLLLVLIRFGGLMIFRLLLPLLVIGALIYWLYRLGQEQEWW
jgi:hypothetical protein